MSLLPFFIPGVTNAINTYSANAVTTSDTDFIENTSISGLSVSKQFTFSAWFNDPDENTLLTATNYLFKLATLENVLLSTLRIYITSGGQVTMFITDENTSTNIGRFNFGGYTPSNGWVNLLISLDLSDTGKRHVYFNDSIPSGLTWVTYTNTNIDWDTITYSAVSHNTDSQPRSLNGDIADVWFNPGTYIDFSIESNRRKFIKSDGKPVGLGSNGQNPTGSSPLLFFSGDTTSWHTNKGTGGGFTENGTLTTASSSPSD